MSYYKLCFLLAFSTAVAVAKLTFPEHYEKYIKDADMKCQREYDVTAEEVNSFFGSADTPEKVKCYYKCLARNMELLNGNSFNKTIIVNKLKDLIETEDAVAIVDKCVPDYVKDEVCEVVYKIMICYKGEMLKYYMKSMVKL